MISSTQNLDRIETMSDDNFALFFFDYLFKEDTAWRKKIFYNWTQYIHQNEETMFHQIDVNKSIIEKLMGHIFYQFLFEPFCITINQYKKIQLFKNDVCLTVALDDVQEPILVKIITLWILTNCFSINPVKISLFEDTMATNMWEFSGFKYNDVLNTHFDRLGVITNYLLYLFNISHSNPQVFTSLFFYVKRIIQTFVYNKVYQRCKMIHDECTYMFQNLYNKEKFRRMTEEERLEIIRSISMNKISLPHVVTETILALRKLERYFFHEYETDAQTTLERHAINIHVFHSTESIKHFFQNFKHI